MDMRPSIKNYEREEEEIMADFDAGLITEQQKNEAIKNLWREWKDIQAEYKAKAFDEFTDWDY